MLRIGLFFLGFLYCMLIQAQGDINLRGRVCDSEGKGIPGVAVYLHETYQGTLSNDSGYFLLAGVKRGNYHLHATFLGYHAYTRDIRVHDSTGFIYIQLEESNLELHEVVIESGTLKLDKTQHAMSGNELNSEYLRKNQGPTLSNALEMVAGVNTINTGVGVSKPVIRGLSGNRILVAENGIRQEGQQWGSDHGLELDPFNAEKIEIIKGPASLLYGSDAIGGVIHIRQPITALDYKHKGQVSAIYRSVNHTLGTSLSASGNRNGLIYRLRYTHLDYGDYAVPADSFVYNRYVLPIYEQRLKNTAGKERHLSGQLGYHGKWGYSRLTVSNFRQQVGVFSGAIGIPRTYDLLPDGDLRNIALPNQLVNHFKIVSNSNVIFGKNWLEIDLGYQYNLRIENSVPHAHGQPAGSSNRAHELHLQSLNANIRYHANAPKGSRVIGLSAQQQNHRFNGFEFLLPKYEAFQTGVFFFEKRKLGARYTLNAGLRADFGAIHIHRHIQGVFKNGQLTGYQERVAENQRSFWNWSGAIGLVANFNSSWLVKANVGKSFRVPNPQELSVNGVHHGSFRHEVGDPNLKAEQGYQADLGIFFERKSLALSMSPYVTYFQNYIFLRPTARFSELPGAGQVYAFEQSRALMAGGELCAEYHPWKSLHIETAVEYVYTNNLQNNLPLPFIPPLQWKSGIEYSYPKKAGPFEKPYLKADFLLAAAQNRVDRNEPPTAGYALVHLGLGTTLHIAKKFNPELSVNIRNLFNTPYLNNLSRWRYLNLPEPGRNINIQLILPVLLEMRG